MPELPEKGTEIKKRCSTCRILKLLEDFYKNAKESMGVDNYCKPCRKKHSKRWYRKNKKSAQKRIAKWNKDHPVRMRELRRNWYAENKDDYNARRKEKRQTLKNLKVKK